MAFFWNTAKKTLRKLYTEYVDLYQQIGSMAVSNREESATKREGIIRKLQDEILPALAKAEQSVSPDELKKIQDELRAEGVLTPA